MLVLRYLYGQYIYIGREKGGEKRREKIRDLKKSG